MTTTLTTMETRVQVREDYRMAYPDPLTLRAGEAVVVVARDTQWPAFVWCTGASGKGGWVPVRYLAIDGAQGRALRDYTAKELTVVVGEEVMLLDEEGGWYWAENGLGEQGWVPAEYLSL